MNLRTKSFLLLTPLIVLPLITVGWLGYVQINQISKSNTFNSTDSLIYNLKKRVSNVSEKAIANIELLSRNSIVEKYAVANDDFTRYNLLQVPLLKTFVNYQTAYPDYYEIRLILPDGYESIRLTENTTIKNTTDDESNSELFKLLIESGNRTDTAILKNPDNDRFALYVFKPLVLLDDPRDSHNDTPTLQAYLVLTVDLSFVQIDIDNQQISDNGKLLIINNKKETIFKSSGMNSFINIPPATLDNLQKDNDNEFNLITLVDEKSSYIKVSQLINNLSLVAMVPKQDILEESHHLGLLTVIVIMITILISLTLLFLALDHFILSPIKTLSLKTLEISKGQFDTAKEITASDEMGILINSFSKMTKDLKTNIEAREEAEKDFKESEERIRLLLDSTAEAIYGLDLNGNCTFCNTACLRMLGYENQDDLLGKNMHKLIHHTRADGSPYPAEDCHINKTLISNEKSHIDTEVFIRKDDSNFPAEYWSHPIEHDGKIIGAVVTFLDITERKHANEQISYQASHDTLTDLVNRREFERRAERLLSTTKQYMEEHALCFMDLDQFKIINDTCGHSAGDEMLRQLSTVLQGIVRHRDTLARLGGDEFGVLMEHCTLDDAHRVATSLQKAIHNYQFSWEGYSFRIGVSIGLVQITLSTTNLTELLKDADAACYMAKDKGRNRIHVYHAEDTEIAQRHGEMQWVTRLNHALEEDRFCLYAQPIEPIDSNTDKHYELLLRMIDETGGIIPPGAFLPAAERYNLISKIDSWVITKAFYLLADNPDFLAQVNSFSINISGQSLADINFQNFVVDKFLISNFPPEKICFEITETAAITNLSIANLFITKMKVLGCQFALDDFGSGLSSFGYLKNMEVDYLKIDGMFVRDIVDDPIDHAMVKSINEIGQVMGMKTIAEFVENDVIKGMLKEIGVNYVQGYGIGIPIPFEELLDRTRNISDINDLTDNINYNNLPK
jgi:diguanylate cyclase (GGDEF)-like protein/PAS domain S-box-containing protein